MKTVPALLKNIVSVFTGKKSNDDQNREAAKKSLEYIFSSIDKLAQKAEGRMTEKWPELSQRIRQLTELVHTLQPDVSTVAGKNEQAIAQKITIISSACEVLLSGGDSKDLNSQLAELEHIVHQRMKPSGNNF